MTDRAAAVLVFLGLLGAAFASGFLLADRLNEREQVTQTYKPEVRTAPGDVVLETKPGATPAKPAPTKPRGGKPVATIELDAEGGKPEQIGADDKGCPVYVCPSLAVRVDIEDDAGQLYAAVRAEDGREITGVFIPQVVGTAPRDKRLTVVGVPSGWLAIASKDAGRWSYGVAGGEIDGEPYAGLSAGFAWR